MFFGWASQVALVVKNPPNNAGVTIEPRFDPWVRKIPGRRACNPLQYSCLENPMNSSKGCKELDMTEVIPHEPVVWITHSLCIHLPTEVYLGCIQVLTIKSKHLCADFCGQKFSITLSKHQ